MAPATDDDEAQLSSSSNGYTTHNDRYRDSPSDTEDDDTIGPDAPLRRGSPNNEFDPSPARARPSWQNKLADRVPKPVKHAWASTVTWVKGPQPPRIYHIKPLFPSVQHVPINLLDRYASKRIQRFWLLVAAIASWLLVFSLILYKSSFAAQIPGYGTPVRLSCAARYWGDGNNCGLNGNMCRPFSNASLAFRCPADCHKQQVPNHAVGDHFVEFSSLVIGGPKREQTGFEDEIVNNAIYRGDSFICASAVHAGFIKDIEGGCGVLTLTGEQASFPAVKRNGILSTGFDSYFPHTFGFLSSTRTQCKDLRWPAIAPTLIFTILVSLFTTDPAVHFWSIFVALFFHVGLVSDPPANTTYYGLLSIAFGRFLPACFCAYVTYRFTSKRSLTGLTAQIEKTVLWLGPAWVGALNNYTFDRIPIQRLTPHDLKAQPGAVPALITIVLAILFIALGQAWAFRVEGRMPRYLAIYGGFVLTLLIFLAIPGLNLRIHHYILGLIFLPGTSFQNRPSLVYQGLLLGLFINGVARWGFASIVELPADILKGSATGSLLPATNVLEIGAKNITFNLGSLPIFDQKLGATYDGISVLVNDVERFRGYQDDQAYWDGNGLVGTGNYSWTWTRHQLGREQPGVTPANPGFGQDDPGKIESDSDVSTTQQVLPEYFRFAFMSGSRTADYTKAGQWDEMNKWIPMEDGTSEPTK
ncbi:Putative LCCL domain-containing protein [Septoria linicola]|uniref:LCCL domain-containing protein n=1 Tax=Septoria linicola TaxID=215465 RepID=A0A9Q9ANJ2_9PEZI|nr:putative LCCL domain-containing protein [Septoria linicola]USW51444.1 Putative LCCL domain-containing protein [Septoria linicola]